MPLVTDEADKRLYLQGAMTSGHHQIELVCDACHTEPFGGAEVLQAACMNCHGEELKAANDAHPRSKFTDPRNAQRVALLDARYCVTCHVEHQPERAGLMGVTLPEDFCVKCHRDIGSERPSHRDLEFTTCASAGCHNFHDKRALYEDFLIAHLDEPEVRREAVLPPLSPVQPHRAALAAEHHDAPGPIAMTAELLREWSETGHARGGVNCADCHRVKDSESGVTRWIDRPGYQACGACHDNESAGFLAGKHGMRLAQGLSAMTPGAARQPMKADAGDHAVGCASCHAAHRFETATAAVESCLGCHDDTHSRAYRQSPHYALWAREQRDGGAPGSGVSCAGCHLPRTLHREAGVETVRVQHNQNDNLRPNEKMARSVCLTCHGLGFTLNALADRGLIDTNFTGRPVMPIPSLDWAQQRALQAAEKEP